MPLFTRTFQIVAGLLSVPVLGVAVIGANYASPFLFHLADVVNGPNTSVVASTNAPNWAIGTSLPVIQGVSAASSTGGTLAPSTTWYFEVSAIDVNGGTTTVSSSASATSDGNATDSILVTWGAIPGASGYAIFFSTTTPTAFTQYFNATTTGQYVIATTTGSRTGSYTKSDTTAFSTLINPLGPSFVESANGTATSSIASTTALEINGNLRAQSNGTTTACFAQTAGVTFYNTANSHEWGCNGTSWQKIF